MASVVFSLSSNTELLLVLQCFPATAISADMLLRQLWHCFLGLSEILF